MALIVFYIKIYFKYIPIKLDFCLILLLFNISILIKLHLLIIIF